MRVAILTPLPRETGGLASRALTTILGLAATGIDLEVYTESPGDLPTRLAEHPDLPIHLFDTRWRYDRWYSNSDQAKLFTGTAARVITQRRLVDALVKRHSVRPFDILYRLSQIELLALRRQLRNLPPLVMHPGTHAYGELRWHWRERLLARETERRTTFAASHAYLGYRAFVQKRDLDRASLVIAPSRRFADHVSRDYGLSSRRFRVIPNPIDLSVFTPADSPPPAKPIRLLFVSRMSVRKGVEMIVALSHRLDDLADRVWIDCIGGASHFSDYQPLLANLNPRTSSYSGELPARQLHDIYHRSHALIQPSRYEPFANTVGEALASGLPVLVSDEVGGGEDLDPVACRVHSSGHLGMLERQVRNLVAEVEHNGSVEMSGVARAEAVRRFEPSRVTSAIREALSDVTSLNRRSP